MTQEFWLVFLARGVTGLLVAWVAGALFFFAAFYVFLPGTPPLSVLTPTLVTVSALGCGAGTASAWFQPGRHSWSAALSATAVLAALAGAWAAFLIGTPDAQARLVDIQTGEVVERGSRFSGLITRPGLQATLLGGTLAANLAVAAGHLTRALRRPPPTRQSGTAGRRLSP